MNERLFSPTRSVSINQCASAQIQTGKLFGFLRRHSSQVSQIALVPDQHDYNIGIRMVSQLFQPPRDVVVRLMLANVVNKQRADCTSVVSRCDGPVALLTRGIPDLRLDSLGIDLNGSSRKLYTDSRLAIEIEFIAGKSAQKIGLADARVSDQNDCTKECSAPRKT